MLEAAAHAPARVSHIFTMYLGAGEKEAAFLPRFEALARQRGAEFVPVWLTAPEGELLRRADSPERREKLKLRDAVRLQRLLGEAGTLPPLPDVLVVDTSELSPTEAAARIFGHVAPALTTPRLWLLPLSLPLLSAHIDGQTDISLPTPEGEKVIHSGPDWAGALLMLLPFWLDDLREEGRLSVPENYVAVRRADGQILGALGRKGQVSADGDAEIGYGYGPAAWGQGYATEAAAALTEHLLGQREVRRVTAQTALTNRASERVLEKCGFVRGDVKEVRGEQLTQWAKSV